MGGEDEEAVKVPTLTKEILRGWQKAILEVRSGVRRGVGYAADSGTASLDSRSAEITPGLPVGGAYE